jgi:GNAT superfamily N-acetyltransferase
MDRELSKLRNRLTEDYDLSSLWITDKIARKGWFLIDLIAVEPESQGQGFGGKAMRELLAFADRRGLKVALTPDALYGSSKSRLTRWYASLGFVPNTDPDVPEEMIRYPQLEPARISAYRWNPDTRVMRRRICGDCGLIAFPGHHCSDEPYESSRPDAMVRRVKTERLKKRELVGAARYFWRRNPQKEYVGNCTDSFEDEGYGDCINPYLPYQDASDLAVSVENATEIAEHQFHRDAFVPKGLANTHDKIYLVDERYGVHMLYDVDADIHYLFV